MKIVIVKIVGNDYCFDLLKSERILQTEEKYGNKSSLFQFLKEDKETPGFCIQTSHENRFVSNEYSPRFVEYTINDLEDLQKIEKDSKNFIDLMIDSQLVQTPEYKNKLDIFLNENKFNNVFYTEPTKEKQKLVIKDNDKNIRDILVNNVPDQDLLNELENIFALYDSTRLIT